MTNLRESAREYEPKPAPNIADLQAVSLDIAIEAREGTDNNTGHPYTYNVAVVAGEEYRVPDSVLKDIKAILEIKPDCRTVKVQRSGKGIQTRYTVIPLE